MLHVKFALLLLCGLTTCMAYSCFTGKHCEVNWRDNEECDVECANELCDYDQGTVSASSPAFDRVMSSDCIYECLKDCTSTQLANKDCDFNCNSPQCGFDAGACGFCKSGCEL